jgi:hypothetical protein
MPFARRNKSSTECLAHSLMHRSVRGNGHGARVASRQDVCVSSAAMYDKFAEEFAARTAAGAYNALDDRAPAFGRGAGAAGSSGHGLRPELGPHRACPPARGAGSGPPGARPGAAADVGRRRVDRPRRLRACLNYVDDPAPTLGGVPTGLGARGHGESYRAGFVIEQVVESRPRALAAAVCPPGSPALPAARPAVAPRGWLAAVAASVVAARLR